MNSELLINHPMFLYFDPKCLQCAGCAVPILQKAAVFLSMHLKSCKYMPRQYTMLKIFMRSTDGKKISCTHTYPSVLINFKSPLAGGSI